MRTLESSILYVVGAVSIFLLVVAILQVGIKKQETLECNQWKEWSNEFDGFYLTNWQKAQCDRYGIKIEAPVK